MKRRTLLKIAGGSLVLAGVAVEGGPARAGESGFEPGFAWGRASAQGLVGQAFWLHHPQAGALPLTLAGLSLHPTKSADPRIEQFTLVFHGPPQPAVAADTYALDHPALGRFQLYLSPGGRAGASAVYRSDFSLLL